MAVCLFLYTADTETEQNKKRKVKPKGKTGKGPEEEDKMKNLKKALAFLLTAAMTMAMGMSSFANETPVTPETGAATTGSITITPPANITEDATYKIYKVFDAAGNGTSISYKLVDGKETAPTGFTVDTAGNVRYSGAGKDGKLTDADIAAITEYVKDDKPVATATATISEEGAVAAAVANDLPNGYYFVTTTTGSVVSINSTNPDVTIQDKNTMTTVVKSAGTEYSEDALKAIAAVGTSQNFTAVITKGHGAKNVIFTDNMTNMSYNGDVKVYAGDSEVQADKYSVSDTADGSGFTVTFEDSYIASLADGDEITLKYSAKITSDALFNDPAKNTATVKTGEKGEFTSKSQDVEVYNAKFTIMKTDGTKALKGAGFVIRNAEGKYYKLDAENKVITWVEKLDDADEHFSGEDGAVAPFTGLANGTYTRIEKTVPAGYNKAADVEFTIHDKDYKDAEGVMHTPFEAKNLAQEETVVNQAGAVLPSTGGMGTTLFYTLGSLLVIGAGVLMVTRRRMELN